ncbi:MULTISPECIES: YceI family protein [unclassified Arcicella]|uniref:YceI family protein n=1 Tax=unclassified Arcicella TaxID=2644986 RepID=UPI00285AC443|nr:MULTISPECIES: YceI family protein [unclassified Arcicella]MDR6562108.1 polyisoprenoid-binding protein YceI [Arcicella sp. BE51]MDR6811980.1 polyisoprenoid-binding protein YceI [Arcicella sp. BE140]MDR6823010.1 polyisoprenoid-binding protein YceI [Arcicella sp. BE139]
MSTTIWAIDPSHSEVQFKVKHLVITTVTGHFKEFSGTVEAGDDFEDAKISFEAKVDSISTNSEQRDGHLKSADFFEVEKYPTLSFTSTKFTKKDDDEFELVGDLTIKGVTNPVKLAVEYGGTATDPWGNVKAGFELTAKINRKDFGLTWNAPTEAGGVLVSEEVKLIANIQLLKQA